ncbi:MAG TPA: DUF4833 domain-containing protein [Polyangiaceae bacterium]|nr:DUF4833 domain-containing protein [Polyangiaceae bacterium]
MLPPTKLSRRCFSLGTAAWLGLGTPTQALAGKRRTLFVIGRSLNANVVHYDVRLNAAGELDRKRPLTAYWVMHAEDGRREDLSWLEGQFAYGWSIIARTDAHLLELRLTAFPQRSVLVRADAAGGARAELRILERAAVLRRIFVQLGDGAGPSVRYIDLFGAELASGKALRERLEP